MKLKHWQKKRKTQDKQIAVTDPFRRHKKKYRFHESDCDDLYLYNICDISQNWGCFEFKFFQRLPVILLDSDRRSKHVAVATVQAAQNMVIVTNQISNVSVTSGRFQGKKLIACQSYYRRWTLMSVLTRLLYLPSRRHHQRTWSSSQAVLWHLTIYNHWRQSDFRMRWIWGFSSTCQSYYRRTPDRSSKEAAISNPFRQQKTSL